MTQEEIEREEKINTLKERHANNYRLFLDHMAADLKIALRKTDYREGALTEEEQRIFWFLLLRTLDRRLCPQFGLNEHDWPMSEERQVRICRELTPEQQVLLLREFMRGKLMENCSVPELIGRLSGDFVEIHQPDAYREIRSRHKDVYDRRLSGIFQRLKTLGCTDTELPVNETEPKSGIRSRSGRFSHTSHRKPFRSIRTNCRRSRPARFRRRRSRRRRYTRRRYPSGTGDSCKGTLPAGKPADSLEETVRSRNTSVGGTRSKSGR